jgi:hypothetical protein
MLKILFREVRIPGDVLGERDTRSLGANVRLIVNL